MGKIIDLHIHTNISDGELTPKEVIDEAIKNGVSTIAISDHDNVDAFNKDVIEYAKSKNINLIKAIELSTKDNKNTIHVLGYNIDTDNKQFKNKLYVLRNARHVYLKNVSEKLRDLGYVIDTKKLDEIDSVTKAHIALDIIENKANEEVLLKTFNHIPNKGEFIETIMNQGCPAYVEKETITPKEAVGLIHTVGGKAVLAHPVSYQYGKNLTIEDIQKIVDEMKPDGIEAYYIYFDKNDNRINEINKWLKFAEKNRLFVTIGSDFHKKDGIHPEIGFKNEKLDIDENTIDTILNNISINNKNTEVKVSLNTKLEVAVEVLANKISNTVKLGYTEKDKELQILLRERDEMYKGNTEIINKIINEYGPEIKRRYMEK